MRFHGQNNIIIVIFLFLLLASCGEDDSVDQQVVPASTNGNTNNGNNGNNEEEELDYSLYTIQELLDKEVSIAKILEFYPMSELYGKDYLGGYIVYVDEVSGEGFVASYENHPEKLTWIQAMSEYPQNNLWILPNPEQLILIFKNLMPNINQDFTIFNYWSSVEYNALKALVVAFNQAQLPIEKYMENQVNYARDKIEFNYVRPVKKFSVDEVNNPEPNNPGPKLTVQQLIDAGVSIADIKEVYGYQSYDIVGNAYLGGMIVYVNIGFDGKVYGGTVMQFNDYFEELNWDNAMALFPNAEGWSMATSIDFSYMISSVTANVQKHPSWSYPYGWHWTPQDGNDQWNNEATAFNPSTNTKDDDAWKNLVMKIRLVKYY